MLAVAVVLFLVVQYQLWSLRRSLSTSPAVTPPSQDSEVHKQLEGLREQQKELHSKLQKQQAVLRSGVDHLRQQQALQETTRPPVKRKRRLLPNHKPVNDAHAKKSDGVEEAGRKLREKSQRLHLGVKGGEVPLDAARDLLRGSGRRHKLSKRREKPAQPQPQRKLYVKLRHVKPTKKV